MKQPNMIFIMADQLRYDMLNCGLTPNIDSIANDGVSFERTYCASPLCVPSRGAIFTGTFPNANGSLINPWLKQDYEYGLVHNSIETFYEIMERSGFDCMHSGKQHLFTQDGKLENRQNNQTKWLCTEKTYVETLKQNNVRMPGGDKFRSFVPEMAGGKHTRVSRYSNPTTGCYEQGEKYYFDSYFAEHALRGMRDRDTSKPLFLSAMFLAPHPPLDIPQPYYNAIDIDDVCLSENVAKWYAYQSPLQMYNLTGAIGTKYTLEQWKETWRVYMGLVKLLDDNVGKILNELKSQGIYDDSIIVFTSDHGEMLGSHRLFQKMCMYEESARTPMYIKFPNSCYKGKKVETAVSQIDLMPTLCDFFKISPKHTPDGKSLLPFLEGNQKDTPVYIQFDGNGARSNFQRCIILGDYKLIADIFKDEVYYELYNVKSDVLETKNLLFVDDAKALVTANEMLKKLIEHMKDTKDLIQLPNINLQQFIETYKCLSEGDM